MSAEHPKTTGWQPIETAPRDGSRILLYHPGGDGEDQERVVAEGVWGRWQGGRMYCWLMAAGDGWMTPTHWTPLPEPPLS